MSGCKTCGSHAINHNLHGRDGSDADLCDVCYWRKRATVSSKLTSRARRKTWRSLIEDDLIAVVIPTLNSMSDSELRLVSSARKKRSTTNCWWLTYAVAPALADAADAILRTREAVKALV